MSEHDSQPGDDARSDYHAKLRQARTKFDPFVYPARTSSKRIRFVLPFQLPPHRSVAVGAWIRRADMDDHLGMWETALDALEAWVGPEGVRTMVDEDQLTFEDLMNVMLDAVKVVLEAQGSQGEVTASPS